MQILLKALFRTVAIKCLASRYLKQALNGRRRATSAPYARNLRSCDQLEAIRAAAGMGLCEYSGWLIAAIEACDRDELDDRRM